jgi:hypothetical protein
MVKQLPPAIHAPYVESFAAALHPVFLAASAISLVAFGLSWLLRDVPLRQSAAAPTESVGETFAVPGEDSSARELERIAAAQVSGTERPGFCRRARLASKTELTSAELSLLARLSRDAGGDSGAGERLATGLERRRLVAEDGGRITLTPAGRRALAEIVESARAELSRRCAVWQCDHDPEAEAVLRRVAESIVDRAATRR